MPRDTDNERHFFMQWYFNDWLSDPAVSMCRSSTRGIWFDLLNNMYKLDRSGTVTGTPEQLAKLGRCSVKGLMRAIEDLERTKAAKVTRGNGYITLTNRRMAREAESRKSNRERQKRHKENKRDVGVTAKVTRTSRDFNGDNHNQNLESDLIRTNTNQSADPRASDDGNGLVGVFKGRITKEDLHDTARVLRIAASLRGRPLSTSEQIEAIAAAERALEAGDKPGGMFRDAIKRELQYADQAQADRARKRFAKYQADQRGGNGPLPIRDLLTPAANGGVR